MAKSISPKHEQLVIFDADMDAALRRFYRRTQAEAVSMDMPYDEMLELESDGLDGDPGDYEWRQRAIGARSIFQYILSEGPHPAKLLKRLFAAGRGLDIQPFSEFTMEEAAMLCGEVKATHSYRCKLLSRLIGKAGMKGVRLPGQKSPESTPNYREAAIGNNNRSKNRKNVKSRKGKKS